MLCQFQFRLRSFRALLAGIAVMLSAGCALSPEQLGLPSAIFGSPSDNALASVNGRSGVPTSDAGDTATTRPRVYEGSGEYINVAQREPATGGGKTANVSADANGITLNLVGASVAEVAKSVLGDILQVNYTVSDKIKATVSLNTTHPVSKDDLLTIFESILRSEGIAMVVETGVYKIVPSESVAASGAPARWNGRGPRQTGTTTEAVPLRYVSATEMERVLKSVAPAVSIVRVDTSRNLLLVSGTSAELASVRDAVTTFDVDWMRGMSFALLPVESSDIDAIAQELDTIFANDKDSPTKGVVRFIPNSRLKSILVISSRPEYLRKAGGWLKRIDIAGQANERQVNVYHVQNRAAGELAVLLQKVYHSHSGRQTAAAEQPQTTVATGEGATGAQVVAVAAPQQPQDADSGTLANLTGGQDAQATPGTEAAQANRATGISIVSDEPNNALVITATPAEYKRIRQILSRIDVAANQLLIEATIAEVTLNDKLRFGLKWFFKAEASQFNLTDSSAGVVAPVFPGFSYFVNMPSVKVALDALNQVTDVNIVSSPSLMVLDNKKATLQIGQDVPIATQSAVSVTTPGAPVVNSISFRNTGVILGITPRVSDNGRVLLDIEQEVSDVIPTTSSNLDSPTFQQRRIKTTVAVSDGESIVLAGLMQDRSELTRTKAPLLGDIPVLGNLFKQKDDAIKRTELLIAITPHVVKDRKQLQGVVDEFRDRINLTTRPQRTGPPDARETADRVLR